MTEPNAHPKPNQPNPPAQGVRVEWQDVPSRLRTMVEQWLGSAIVSVVSQPSGFSPGVAVRVRTADDRRVFIKAIGPKPNPDSPHFHRREGKVTAVLPEDAPVPPLLWSYDDQDETGWVVLVFEEIDGQHPAQPWLTDELHRVVDALAVLHDIVTPSPLSYELSLTAGEQFANHIRGWQPIQEEGLSYIERLDDWSRRHLAALIELEQMAGEAAAGDTLLNFDVRADNILMTPDRVWFLDWPHACVGAGWVDVIGFAPSVRMQGGPAPEVVIQRYLAGRDADPAAISAVIAALAGFFTYRALRPPPPGLPTVRQFQNAQGIVAREWLAQRMGWS